MEDGTADSIAVKAQAATGQPAMSSQRRVALFAMRNALPVVFVGIIILFVALGAPNFLTLGNASDILRLSAPVMVVAVPMAFLLIMGHVDLSVGSTLALSAVVVGLVSSKLGWPPLPAIVAGVAASALIGLLNGVLATYLGLSPVIVTLGMLTAVRGGALLLAPNNLYAFFSDDFAAISYTGAFGVPYFGMIALVVVLIGAFFLAWSPVGRHALAIGVNEDAAFLSGINVRATILVAYVVTAALAGVAGVMYAMLLNSAPSGSLGLLFELDVLIGVMLGGIAFNGGRGTIRGAVLGVLFLAILQNGLILLGVPTSVGFLLKGAVLILAAALDRATLRAMSAVKGR
jgi:ribose/xylose/arabinose/galactoside ABC-type transport system permease subunit